MVACTLEYKWPTYVVASLVSLFGGVIVMFPIRQVYTRLHWCTTHGRSQTVMSRLQGAAEAVLYGNTHASKAIVVTFWVLDMASSVVYIIEATQSDPQLRAECGTIKTPTQIIWITLMCCSLLRFIVKFLAADDKIRMWIHVESIVDHFTIVPTFVGIYYDNNWLGFRFFRVLHLLRLHDMLQLTNIVQKQPWLRFVSAVTIVISAWSFGAGMFYLIENSADPWRGNGNPNPQPLYFWDCYYLVLIILTTIGFGDLYPKTDLGKMFLAVFVLMCLATFGQLLPEFAQLFSDRSKYKVPYKNKASRRHVVITGNITFETLTSVMKNFISQDNEKPDIVIINRDRPSSKMQAFFRRNYNNVTFIEGTVLHIPTLRRAKVETTVAVLILANRLTESQDKEDCANIMRATAVKNYRPDVRIVIQLVQHRNKEQLLHIPSWSWSISDGDEVVCISELKMGIMAKNCLAPGCATLLSNLITTTPVKTVHSSRSAPWMKDYQYGADHRVYAERLPDAFSGMTFSEAAELCYRQFDILLIAIDHQTNYDDQMTQLRVNPASSCHIHCNQLGFFIAPNQDSVRRVAQYRVRYNCQATREINLTTVVSSSDLSVAGDSDASEMNEEITTYSQQKKSSVVSSAPSLVRSTSLEDSNNNPVQEIFDPTGTVYWCPSSQLQDVLLDSDLVREYNLMDHIIFVLNTSASEDKSCRIGLRNFLMPLRASSIRAEELKVVVFYVSLQFIETEWDTIACFPRVFVFQRSESLHRDMKALNIHKCAICLVMETTGLHNVDNTLVDINAIQTTMQITSVCHLGKNLSQQLNGLTSPEELYKQMTVNANVPLLIELEHDASVTYIDDDDDDDPSIPVAMTTPYACGRVLLASVLDSLVTTALLNSDVMRLFRTIITGVELTDFETVLANGLGIVRRHAIVDHTNTRCRPTLTLVELSESPLDRVQHDNEYGQLVVGCLRSHGIICLGIYRLMQQINGTGSHQHPLRQLVKMHRQQKRYVITNPPFGYQLLPTDMVYILKPFDNDQTSYIQVV